MTQKEKQCYESVFPVVNLFWIPATWFTSALNEAVKDGILTNESGAKLIMEVLYFDHWTFILDCIWGEFYHYF